MKDSMLKSAVGAASEAEVATSHENSRKGAFHCLTLTELDHPQHQTPLKLDNDASCDILTNTITPKRSK